MSVGFPELRNRRDRRHSLGTANPSGVDLRMKSVSRADGRHSSRITGLVATLALLLPGGVLAQGADRFGEEVQRYISVPEPVVAITGVTLLDGTGAPARSGQTVVVAEGRIRGVGADGTVQIPAGARSIDGSGHTLIPGIFGLHNHLYYTSAGGRSAQLTYTGPRLYLGTGVTTVRTTGSRAPYLEINQKVEIEAGRLPGPRIHITAPYITGGQGGTTMTLLNTPEEARRFTAYWAAEGATWLKAYTNIRREELAAAIQEAHRHGVKVTGHLCSVTFREAVEMGIDNLEHGLFTATDYDPEKELDRCSPNTIVRSGELDVNGPEVQETFRLMVENNVPMTSTLAVYELYVPNRPTRDPRALEAMSPEVRADYLRARDQIDGSGRGTSLEAFRNAMAFERAFVDAGGLLAAGVDPTGNGGALPGYGDQRNYELLREGGFSPEETVRIMTLNGAIILGEDGELGSVEAGKIADLVLLHGDLTRDDAVINRTVTVFKDGVGYDSTRLLDDVKGRVGIN